MADLSSGEIADEFWKTETEKNRITGSQNGYRVTEDLLVA